MEILLGLVFIVVALASLWFWIRTLAIMNRENMGWSLGGFFVAPIVQIIFYITEKDNLSAKEKSPFKLFFITQAIIMVLFIVVSSMMTEILLNNMNI